MNLTNLTNATLNVLKLLDEYSGSHVGLAPFVLNVKNQLTYRLVTGVAAIDPYRGSAGGRAYSDDIYHIYTADRIDVCSGEVLGCAPVPPNSLVGEYLISGHFIDYDRIPSPGFQELWRGCSGEQRHDFSQAFTRFLISRDVMPHNVIGGVWTSISGEALGIGGRCYGITASGEPHVRLVASFEYPQSSQSVPVSANRL